jgi:hypothetical protein
VNAKVESPTARVCDVDDAMAAVMDAPEEGPAKGFETNGNLPCRPRPRLAESHAYCGANPIPIVYSLDLSQEGDTP